MFFPSFIQFTDLQHSIECCFRFRIVESLKVEKKKLSYDSTINGKELDFLPNAFSRLLLGKTQRFLPLTALKRNKTRGVSHGEHWRRYGRVNLERRRFTPDTVITFTRHYIALHKRCVRKPTEFISGTHDDGDGDDNNDVRTPWATTVVMTAAETCAISFRVVYTRRRRSKIRDRADLLPPSGANDDGTMIIMLLSRRHVDKMSLLLLFERFCRGIISRSDDESFRPFAAGHFSRVYTGWMYARHAHGVICSQRRETRRGRNANTRVHRWPVTIGTLEKNRNKLKV